jgi:hypothetical protein
LSQTIAAVTAAMTTRTPAASFVDFSRMKILALRHQPHEEQHQLEYQNRDDGQLED